MAQDHDKKPGDGTKRTQKDTQFTSETARENQLKSAKARSNNVKRDKEKAEWFQMCLDAIRTNGSLDPLDAMRSLMASAALRGDEDMVLKVAKELAPYEKPRLSSVESKATITDLTESSNKDLVARAEALGIDVSQLSFLHENQEEDEQRPQ